MLEKKDVRILCRLRRDARENLTKMSRATSIPVSTLYDRLKKYLDGMIDKPTVLLNYASIGYDIRVALLLKAPSENKGRLESFLRSHGNVNNVARINNGYDFMAEVLFRSVREFKDFSDAMSRFGISAVKEFFVLEDIKREGFLTESVVPRAS